VKHATKQYLATATLLVGMFTALQFIATGQIGRAVRDDAAFQLEQAARLTLSLLAERAFDDVLADSLGAAQELRVTLIARDGTVLGDSDVARDRLPDIENHADRPEVRAALSGNAGVAERASETIAQSQLYVAIPAPNGVLRLSRSLESATAAARARQQMIVALLAALVIAYPASRMTSRRLTRRLEVASGAISDLAVGRFRTRTRFEGGDPVATLGQAIDRLADSLEERVERSDERTADLRRLFDSLEDGVAFVDARALVQIRNPAFERLAGRSVPDGARMSTVFRSPVVLQAIERAQNGESTADEIPLGERTLLMSALPHRGGALLIFRDLTRLRRLEGVRRDFVANVSHELKTPLTSIVGFAEAMSSGDLSADVAETFGRRVLANASRMRRLVDDLLDLSLIESGSWSPDLESVVIEPAVRAAWQDVSPETEPGPTLVIDDPEESGVRADARAVHQILVNLLGNALRYAPPGSEVTVRVRATAGFVRTEVGDRGAGIPAAHLGRVFERFYRVDPGRSREQGGTGLGLAIVRHLVVAHGGDIGIDSAISRGTTVWFTLPASDVEPLIP
jgi:two-component system phosphate regulon sensor histidine kinase PhoR